MLSFWTSEEVFFDGDQYFDRMLKDIEEAQTYITVEMYIFNDDVLGRLLTEKLIAAHSRGVKVQLIVDGVGSYAFFDKLHKYLSQNGVMIKMYNPLPFYHPYYGDLTLIRRLQVMFIRIMRVNKRNHRKIITIDSHIMYTGSFNVTVEHTHHHTEIAWKDIGVRVTGDQVRFTVLNFKKIWKLRDYYRYKRQIKSFQSPNWRYAPLRLNQTVFMKRYFYKSFLNKINHSQKRIWFMTPYFIPKRRLIRALGKAAKRGVDVKIIISFKTDVPMFRTLQYFYYDYLLKKGVKVYQYTDSVLHAKNYIIDDWMTIGSTNLNHRSFMHDLEVDLIIQDEKNMRIIEQNFIESTSNKNSISIEALNERPFLDRILCRLFFLFKYWF
ncbi:MAG TPA: phospholipase D-like domain-containing protein [Bacteriovoracaceae bacterium]|nr:phospholipase D-like domain-containing protein [Bacteriovoracaceae bacterium]